MYRNGRWAWICQHCCYIAVVGAIAKRTLLQHTLCNIVQRESIFVIFKQEEKAIQSITLNATQKESEQERQFSMDSAARMDTCNVFLCCIGSNAMQANDKPKAISLSAHLVLFGSKNVFFKHFLLNNYLITQTDIKIGRRIDSTLVGCHCRKHTKQQSEEKEWIKKNPTATKKELWRRRS